MKKKIIVIERKKRKPIVVQPILPKGWKKNPIEMHIKVVEMLFEWVKDLQDEMASLLLLVDHTEKEKAKHLETLRLLKNSGEHNTILAAIRKLEGQELEIDDPHHLEVMQSVDFNKKNPKPELDWKYMQDSIDQLDLTERERWILKVLYNHRNNQSVVATLCGVSQSYVSQVVKKARQLTAQLDN